MGKPNTRQKRKKIMLKEKNKIAFYVKCGEKADVDIAIVEDWNEKLPNLLEGYNPCDILDMDERGLFFSQN